MGNTLSPMPRHKLDGVSRCARRWKSIINAAATLSYDRLGVGRSDHPNGVNDVQIAYEVAQSAAIASALRSGSLADAGTWNKIVGVGHCTWAVFMFDKTMLT